MREKVWIHCVELVEKQLKALQDMMVDLRASAAQESKSTAGDKHETARAMVQIEQEQLQRQINIVQSQLNQLQMLKDVHNSEEIRLGQLVSTTQGQYYICAGIGKIHIEGKDILSISPTAPLGRSLIGKKKDDVIYFNNRAFRILDIV